MALPGGHLHISRHTAYHVGMTMLSFRADPDLAAEVRRWADHLGIDRSELLRDALRHHLVRLRAEEEVEAWHRMPPTAEEQSLAEIADWGPAEDWSDWAHGAR